ncbi:MAG: 2-oxo-4-hydroxy-4-carboxy-5-ureidoimidazoline decarboxylase [Chloroflexales bacterium]|nr:2-oxo-4-hydroxy-4-carboxy-5-ureidoimidazoline decarboxylase [Chloroflexales bacterium]
MLAPITLAELNALDRAAFVGAVGHCFERSPWIAEAAWPQRPFASLADLHAALSAVLDGADEARQVALIRAHPDLAGRVALAGQLTAESAREQAAAGLTALSAEELARFSAYNSAYRERFGFPFVICARENKKEAILAALPARLASDRDAEIQTALAEIKKIARLRLCDCLVP